MVTYLITRNNRNSFFFKKGDLFSSELHKRKELVSSSIVEFFTQSHNPEALIKSVSHNAGFFSYWFISDWLTPLLQPLSWSEAAVPKKTEAGHPKKSLIHEEDDTDFHLNENSQLYREKDDFFKGLKSK